MKGYVQVYTGNGKGKTTAAIGLAIRAAGAGLPVFFAQFVKGLKYSEIGALERYADLIAVRQYGRGCFITREAEKEDIEQSRKGLADSAAALAMGKYRLVVLDEACIAIHYKLFSIDDLLQVIDRRKTDCEVVVTGRYAPQELLDMADLVTEMKEVKHYYAKGVQARTGIER
jgi:cob(I)alamin adenosyltransferase